MVAIKKIEITYNFQTKEREKNKKKIYQSETKKYKDK